MRRAILLSVTMAMTIAFAAKAEDRYGPPPMPNPGAAEAPRTLTWPGKTPSGDATAPTSSKPSAAPQTRPAGIYDATPPHWPQSTAAPTHMTQPTPTSNPQTVREGLPPHFYSVARQYGVQPDPVQLSPQFLAATPQADMAEPPPLPPSHVAGQQTANMSTAAATNQLRQAQEAAADADSAALGN